MRLTLLENAAAGNGADVICPRGGKFAFLAEATWGGGNVKLQLKSPQGTYSDVASSTLSANGMLALELPPGTYRAVAATGSVFYAWLIAHSGI